MSIDNAKAWDRGPLRPLFRGSAAVGSTLEGLLFGNGAPRNPPVFIGGFPRAGTTLFYQLVCHCFRVSYPVELANWLPVVPAFAAWLGKLRARNYSSDFVSDYGRSSNWYAPGEGTMWNFWLEKDQHYRGLNGIGSREAVRLERMVGRIERIGGGPFVNKNLRHNNRVPLLAELFPASVFLIVLRSPLATAQSILRGREQQLGDPNAWFSIKPRSYAELAPETPERQVAHQLSGLLRDLIEDMHMVGPDRFAAIDYADLCRSPATAMADLQQFLHDRDIEVLRRHAPPQTPGEYGGNSDGASQSAALRAAIEECFPSGDYGDLPCTRLAFPPEPYDSGTVAGDTDPD